MGSPLPWIQFLARLQDSPHNGPSLGSLRDIAARVDTVVLFLTRGRSESPAEDLYVAQLAIRFALQSLEDLGLCDGDEPPMPTTGEEAMWTLQNIQYEISQHLVMALYVAAGSMEHDQCEAGVHANERRCVNTGDLEQVPGNSPIAEKDQVVAEYLKRFPDANIRGVAMATKISKSSVQRLPVWKKHCRDKMNRAPTSKRAIPYLHFEEHLYSPVYQQTPEEVAIEKEDAEQFLLGKGLTKKDFAGLPYDILTIRSMYEDNLRLLKANKFDVTGLCALEVVKAQNWLTGVLQDDPGGSQKPQ